MDWMGAKPQKAIFINANKTVGFHHPNSVDIKSPGAEPDLFGVL